LRAAATHAIEQLALARAHPAWFSGTSRACGAGAPIANGKRAGRDAFNSGYAAAVGTLPSVAGKNDVIVSR